MTLDHARRCLMVLQVTLRETLAANEAVAAEEESDGEEEDIGKLLNSLPIMQSMKRASAVRTTCGIAAKMALQNGRANATAGCRA